MIEIVLVTISLLGAGLIAWTFIEYAIHGWLGHVFATFAGPFHAAHHRDPHAVFTVGVWIPVAIVWIAGLAVWGFAPAMVFFTGILAGFVIYEALHYRMHFAAPSCALESRLRARHLAHHLSAPDVCFGVTSALWDRAFATEPGAERMARLAAQGAGVAPLSGRSNFRHILHLGIPAR